MPRITRITLFILLLAIPSCSSPSTSTDAPGAPAQRLIVKGITPDRGRSEERNLEYEAQWDEFYATPHDPGDTLVVGLIADADSLNPLTSETKNAHDILDLLTLTLTHINPDYSSAPSLARSWEFSEDHLELTFHLRDDVYWHDGVKTTAHDVCFTLRIQ